MCLLFFCPPLRAMLTKEVFHNSTKIVHILKRIYYVMIKGLPLLNVMLCVKVNIIHAL